MHPFESKATLLILLSLSVDKYALVANVESYSKGGVVDMLMHRIVDVVLVRRFIHNETAATALLLPTKTALKIDLVSILAVNQQP